MKKYCHKEKHTDHCQAILFGVIQIIPVRITATSVYDYWNLD